MEAVLTDMILSHRWEGTILIADATDGMGEAFMLESEREE